MTQTGSVGATLAVIPARGGSKRIPRKNIRPFLGVPLLARTVELLQRSGLFDRIVVSTDDDEIAAVATSAGAEVPFRRPADLANDTAATLPVIAHAIGALDASGPRADLICAVYPAAVLSQASDFRDCLALLQESPGDYSFPATTFRFPIQRALRLHPDRSCSLFWPEQGSARSQDLEPAYHDAGQFYWGRRDAWLAQRPIFSNRSRMLVIPHHRVQDIDTIDDWQRAEAIYKAAGHG
jgi:pseudaminic acid cytidylyltransferase